MLRNSPIDTPCPWIDDTRAAILALPRETRQRDVSQATGIPEQWLSKFINGKFKSPNVQYLYILYTAYAKSTNV